MKWKAYNQLAWTELFLAGPESYEEEAKTYIKILERYISVAISNDTALRLRSRRL